LLGKRVFCANKIITTTAILFFFVHANAYAGGNEMYQFFRHHMEAFISAGGAFSNLSNDETLRINSFVVNRYATNTNSQIEPLTGLGIGYVFNDIYEIDNRPFDLNLNLSAYYLNFDKVKGTEYPFVNAGSFDTLNYQFSADSTFIMIEPRLLYTINCWQPYLLLGIGVSSNRLDSYNEEPTNSAGGAAPVPIMFGGHTMNAFAYEAGFGVQRQIFADQTNKLYYFLSLDYRYINLGEGQLANFPAKTSGSHLTVSQLDTQSIMLSLRVHF